MPRGDSVNRLLEPRHLEVLSALQSEGGVDGANAATVAETLGIKTMSAATLLAALRDWGYVRRSTESYSTCWCLTDEGAELTALGAGELVAVPA